MFVYTVRCRFQSEGQSISESWLTWLRDEHIRDVLQAGAISAEIVAMVDDDLVYEIRYRFESRQSFQIYEQNHAPRLRQDGLKRFPLELGLEYSRDTGQILDQFSELAD